MTEAATMENVTVENTEAQATAQPEATTEQATTTPDFAIPEEFKESAWAQGLDSQDALWKKLAGSQKLIGDRGAYIPQDGATDEQVNEFLNRVNEQFGDKLKEQHAIKAPESYEFGELELPEGISIADNVTEKFSEIAKANGLSNEQAQSIRQQWINHEVETMQAREEALNTEFEAMAKDLWGENWTDATAEASQILADNVPESMREAMVDMPNQYLVPLVATLRNMQSKSDGIVGGSKPAELDKDQARARFSELRQKAAKDPAKYGKDFQEFNEKYRGIINS